MNHRQHSAKIAPSAYVQPCSLPCAILLAVLICFLAGPAAGQTTSFTFQGALNDGGSPASGSYDLQFRVFDAVTGGVQQGPVLVRENVQVASGIFNVTLDFGGGVFSGAIRFLEIGVRPGTSTSAFTILSPRQQLTSTPYAIKSLSAATADGLSSACVNCVTSSQIGSLPSGNGNYIQNTTTQQGGANFNISGNGTVGQTLNAGVVNAETQYNIAGTRVLSMGGTGNLFAGLGAGQSNTTGASNAFYGLSAGFSNTTGGNNAFFGRNAGFGNIAASNNSFFGWNTGPANTGGNNSFFGWNAGAANTTGSSNTAIGAGANLASGGLSFATAIGAGAVVSASNTVAIGRASDAVSVPGNLTVSGTLTATLPGNSTSYIQNTSTPQAGANFNISGDGMVGGKLTANAGVSGSSASSTVHGVSGSTTYAPPFGGPALIAGVFGSSSGASGTGVIGEANNGSGANGVWGKSVNGSAVRGTTTSGIGVYGISASGTGVYGASTTGEAGHFQGKVAISEEVFLSNNRGIFMRNTSGLDKRILLADPSNILRIGSGGGLGFDRIDFDLGAVGTVMSLLANGNVNIGKNMLLGNNLGIYMKNAAGADKRVLLADTANTLRVGSGGGQGFDRIDFDLGTPGTVMSLLANGTTVARVLQITGGGDLSEQFEINAAPEAGGDASSMLAQPGVVVSIDPQNPGKLIVSNRAYDRRVAGIVSGAGGIKPGMMMSQVGSVADGNHPVALTGRVYCWADASNGPIEPGDLLTTSAVPGHAMKVSNHSKAQAKAQGAILGKAMTGLKSGRGLVLVLVTLQ